jgi:hypothetical protein
MCTGSSVSKSVVSPGSAPTSAASAPTRSLPFAAPGRAGIGLFIGQRSSFGLMMDRPEAETSEAFIVILQPGKSPHLRAHADTGQGRNGPRGDGASRLDADGLQRDPITPGTLQRIPPQTIPFGRGNEPEWLGSLGIDGFLGERPQDAPTWESRVPWTWTEKGWGLDRGRTRTQTMPDAIEDVSPSESHAVQASVEEVIVTIRPARGRAD